MIRLVGVETLERLLRIERVNGNVVPVCCADHGVDRRKPLESATPRGVAEAFAHHQHGLASIAQPAEMGHQRTERRGRHLRSHLLDARRIAGDEVLLERVPRLVITSAPFESLHRVADQIAIARHADRQEGIERPQDGDQIPRPEIIIDEPRQRVADAGAVGPGAHVVLVEKNRKQPRSLARRLFLLVEFRADRRQLGLGRLTPFGLDESQAVDWV